MAAATPAQAQSHKRIAKYRKGKDITQAGAMFGKHTLSQPLTESGSMYILAHHG
jgi:hypothetical protein